jgi:D-alanyl-D-alanine carboxypeptidase
MAIRADSVESEYLARLRKAHRKLGIPDAFLDHPRLPLCIEPEHLVDTEPDFYQRPQKLTPDAHLAWMAMRDAAASEGVVLHLISAFRGIDYQAELIRRKLQNGGLIDDILAVVAAPGFSEHHTGRAIDLNTEDCAVLEEEFEKTIAFQWLMVKAQDFGFVLSYPRDNRWGIAYEPWHWCYQPLVDDSRIP